MKILVADDDLVSRRMLEKALVRAGYEVVAVADGLVESGQFLDVVDQRLGHVADEVCLGHEEVSR